MHFAKPLAELIAELERLPGVGPKSAQRLAYHLLKVPVSHAAAIENARRTLRFCRLCQDVSEAELCTVCADPRRDHGAICVVGEPRDVAAIERTHEFRGLYHVLHGLMSPMDGVGPDQLRIKELLERLEENPEVILATNPTIEGDATALYIARLLKPLGVKVTRLAHGMPVGGELDYADSATLVSALEFRREM